MCPPQIDCLSGYYNKASIKICSRRTCKYCCSVRSKKRGKYILKLKESYSRCRFWQVRSQVLRFRYFGSVLSIFYNNTALSGENKFKIDRTLSPEI